MLKFTGAWRFDSPASIAPGVFCANNTPDTAARNLFQQIQGMLPIGPEPAGSGPKQIGFHHPQVSAAELPRRTRS